MATYHHVDAKNVDMGFGLNLDDIQTACLIVGHMAKLLNEHGADKNDRHLQAANKLAKKLLDACKQKEEDVAREIIEKVKKEGEDDPTYNIMHMKAKR